MGGWRRSLLWVLAAVAAGGLAVAGMWTVGLGETLGRAVTGTVAAAELVEDDDTRFDARVVRRADVPGYAVDLVAVRDDRGLERRAVLVTSEPRPVVGAQVVVIGRARVVAAEGRLVGTDRLAPLGVRYPGEVDPDVVEAARARASLLYGVGWAAAVLGALLASASLWLAWPSGWRNSDMRR